MTDNHDNKPKPRKTLFCYGYGYVAEHLAQTLKSHDDSWKIVGTTTDMEKLAILRESGLKSYLFSDKMPFNDPLFAMDGATHILISVPPKADGDVVFKAHAREILQIPTIEWIGYISSTSVYGNRNGDWVDEKSETAPSSERGSKRAKAEIQWLKLRRIAGIPINIFRLAGLYGPERSAIDTVQAGNARRIHKQGHAFNRIHIDDVVQVLIESMKQPSPGDIYNLADDSPEPSHELIKYACELMGKDIPPLIDWENADLSPMARSFYKDNKRVSNRKIKEKLGVALKYPDYKSGLKSIFDLSNSPYHP